MAAAQKNQTVPCYNSYNSLYVNPLMDPKQYRRGGAEDHHCRQHQQQPLGEITEREAIVSVHKEQRVSSANDDQTLVKVDAQNPIFRDKENLVPNVSSGIEDGKLSTGRNNSGKANLKEKQLKPTSLQFCMQFNEPDSTFGVRIWNDPITESEKSGSANMWAYSDSEASPASSWSTLPNRALLCKPLPVDVGKCTCFIVKEGAPKGFGGATLYSLYTNEGHGRQNRKLAVACHRRRGGCSEFIVAQNSKGILYRPDDSFMGLVTANLLGSKYYIWDQGTPSCTLSKQFKSLEAVVQFMPTLCTWTGSYRRMKAWIPRHEMLQPENIATQNTKGLPKHWRGKRDRVNQLASRVPQYSTKSKQYELDFRERGKASHRIQSSVKNFQLTLEGNARQTILQLGREGKCKYLMDYRYPLTGYQAFCMCLASIDSKLCCTL